jgi:CheY-like chemotaxis protein
MVRSCDRQIADPKAGFEMANATVLLADDDIDCLRLMALRCQSLGLRVLTASDGMDTLASVIRNSPDLLVLDINMPGGHGFSVAEKLMRDPKIPPTPVVFCSGGSDPATLARCKDIGAHYVTKGGESWSQLRSIICHLLDLEVGGVPAMAATADSQFKSWAVSPGAALPKVLCVDDDEDMLRLLRLRLRACGLNVLTASSAMQALWIAMKEMPAAIVTDYRMPEGSGEYLIGRLRAVPALRDIPVVVVTAASGGLKRDFALERRFLGEYGVGAFLPKPLVFGDLLDALAQHIEIDPKVLREAKMLMRQ